MGIDKFKTLIYDNEFTAVFFLHPHRGIYSVLESRMLIDHELVHSTEAGSSGLIERHGLTTTLQRPDDEIDIGTFAPE